MPDLFWAIQVSICSATCPDLSVQKGWYTMQTAWSTAPCLHHKCGYEYSEDKHDKKTDLIHIAIYLVWVINLHHSHLATYFMHVILNVHATAQYHSVTETLCGKMTSTFPGTIILVM